MAACDGSTIIFLGTGETPTEFSISRRWSIMFSGACLQAQPYPYLEAEQNYRSRILTGQTMSETASTATIILLSLCSFLGNIGAAVTAFGQAIILMDLSKSKSKSAQVK